MRTVTGPWGSFRAWDHDILGNAIAKGEFWDQQIQSAIDEADPTGWAIDLGANIGWFTVYMAKRFAHVLAVEAHPGTYKLLVENVTSHEVTHKVTTIGGAAYDAAVDLWMVPAVWHGWPDHDEYDLDTTINAASVAFVPVEKSAMVVPGFPVDVLLARCTPRPRVTCLKVDCQGADLRALKGLHETIVRDRPIIIFEYEMGASLWHRDTWQDYEVFFIEHHYQITRIREDLWDYVARPL